MEWNGKTLPFCCKNYFNLDGLIKMSLISILQQSISILVTIENYITQGKGILLLSLLFLGYLANKIIVKYYKVLGEQTQDWRMSNMRSSGNIFLRNKRKK